MTGRNASTRTTTGAGRGQPYRVCCAVAFLVTLIVSECGCRTTHYTARNLPPELHTPPVAASTGINLEQMAGTGAGTSQIGPGDLVEVTIVSGSGEERATPMPARVADDGTVMIRLIGSVPVGGLEPTAAEQRIAAAAVERGIYRRPYVTLSVTDRAVNRVSVLGAVAKPGIVELPRGSSDLASALAAAGGLAKEASTRVEILHRGGGPSRLVGPASETSHDGADSVRLASYTNAVAGPAIPFAAPAPLEPAEMAASVSAGYAPPTTTRIDLAEALPGSRQSHSQGLEDRDVVMVLPEEARVVHVTGLVVKPNQFELPRDKDIRVLDAVAMAGGTASPLADKVYVLRHLPDMPEPAVIKVSLSAAKRRGEENLRLAAGDLVSVESTLSTMTLDTVSRFFRVGLGVSSSIAAF